MAAADAVPAVEPAPAPMPTLARRGRPTKVSAAEAPGSPVSQLDATVVGVEEDDLVERGAAAQAWCGQVGLRREAPARSVMGSLGWLGRIGATSRRATRLDPFAAAADYEQARIRENMERMRKLGILGLVETLNMSAAAGVSGGGTGRGRRRKPVEPGSAPAAPRVRPAPAQR